MKKILFLLLLSNIRFAGNTPPYKINIKNCTDSSQTYIFNSIFQDIYMNKRDITDNIFSANVGIGTTNPQATLQVNGTVTFPNVVKQIKHYESNISSTTFSVSFVGTNLSVTLTPSTTSSIFFIEACGDIRGDNLAYLAYVTLFRNSTNLEITSGQGMQAFGGTNTATGGYLPVSFHKWDSPGTTSPVTYQVAFRTNEGSVKADWNSQQCTATITVFEYAQ